MNFDFSKHALEQMQLRQISVAIANKVLNNPDQGLSKETVKKYINLLFQQETKNI